jgi:hypothetical protein
VRILPLFKDIESTEMLMLLISVSSLLDNKIIQNKRHKEPGKNTEESNGCVKPKRTDKWPNSTIDRYCCWRWRGRRRRRWWWWWYFMNNKTVPRNFFSFTQLMECLIQIYVLERSIEIQRGKVSFVCSILLAISCLSFFLPNSVMSL